MSPTKRVKWQPASSVAEAAEMVRQAADNGLTVKHTFGRFPVSSEPADVAVSLAGLSRLLGYDPLRQTVTVEPGIAISDLLARLEHYDLTLDLPGWVIDLTVGDAIATGLPGFADILERCTLLTPRGESRQLDWHDASTAPSMQAVVCGLGTMGVVTSATLSCVANRRALECSRVVTAAAAATAAAAGTTAIWFPLSGRAVVTTLTPVRLGNAALAPGWVSVGSAALSVLQRFLRFLAAPLVWHFPCLALPASALQLLASAGRARLRHGRCFPAPPLLPPGRHSAGIRWAASAQHAPALLQAVTDWARRNPRHVSSPVRLDWISPAGRDRRPLLEPGPPAPHDAGRALLLLWVDWFGAAALDHDLCLPMAGLEAALQGCGGVKCWSAGPAPASALIGAGYAGFQRWRTQRWQCDPGAVWRSAYVEGDIAGARSS